MKNLFLILFFLPAFVEGQIITTIAGNGLTGYGVDSVLAISNKIGGETEAIAFDAIGNYYIAMGSGVYKIRKVTTTGIIYTIAGTGVSGYSGDGGLAINAMLKDPGYIAFDKTGNLYVSDITNCRVRKIDKLTGIITTVAGKGICGYSGDGGPADSAELNIPTGICFDIVGNLYIADADNFRIRMVDTTGIIHPFAGNGINAYTGDNILADTASMDFVHDLCIDSSGNLYVSETNVIYRIDATTKIIHRIAGNASTTGNAGDGGPATSASLGAIHHMALSPIGELFLSDASGTSYIRKIDTAGIIHHVAGNGLGGYNGDGIYADIAELWEPRGIVFDSCENLYICDCGNYRIRKITFPYCGYTSIVNQISINTESIALYPNPATTELTIQSSYQPITQITITNLLGQTVYTNQYNAPQVQVDVSRFPTGIYFLKINGSEVRKFVKE